MLLKAVNSERKMHKLIEKNNIYQTTMSVNLKGNQISTIKAFYSTAVH